HAADALDALQFRLEDVLGELAEVVLEPELKRIQGVSRVEVYGGRERIVQATFDAVQLASYRLRPGDLVGLLAAENQNTRGGNVDEEKNRWVVRTVGEFRTAEDVEQVVLRRPGMPDVRMEELLDVTQHEFKDAEAYVRTDGSPSIVFAVHKKTGENVVAIMQDVYRRVEDLNTRVLVRMDRHMEVVYDESEYVDRSIDQLQENVIFCALLAGAVLLLFLRNPSAILTVFVTIPISFIATFIFLWQFGRTLNVVSLAGLAFAVGMLVDNAIVVLENIYRHRQMGKGPARAALDGAGEVWGAVLAATLTTVAVFIPILLIQEEAGQLFRDIVLAIAVSVALSMAVSMTVIPMLSSKILRTQKAKPKEAGPTRRLLRRVPVRIVLVGTAAVTVLMAVVALALLAWLAVDLVALTGAVPPVAEWFGDPMLSMMLGSLTPLHLVGLVLLAGFVALGAEGPRLFLKLDRMYPDVGQPLGMDALDRMNLLDWTGATVKRGITLTVHWLMQGVGRRAVVGGGILAVFAYLMVFFFVSTPKTYLPMGNRNFAMGFVLTEAGASVDHNLEVAQTIEDRIMGLPGVEKSFMVTLRDRVFFGARAADADEARLLATRMGAAVGNTPLMFMPEFMHQQWLDEYGEYLKEPIAGVRVFVQQVGLFQREGTLAGQTITVVVRGDDIDRLYDIGDRMQARIEKVPGVQGINPSYKRGNWEIRPVVDRRRAADAGLSAREVGLTVGAIVNGVKVADFREASGNELDLILRGRERYREHIERLGDLPVWTPRGGTVLLGQVAPVQPAAGYNVIQHTEQQRSIELEVQLAPDAAIGAVTEAVEGDVLRPMEEAGIIPSNYIPEVRGQARDLVRMWRELQWSLVIALVIVYLLMAALFESFAHPFVIMLTVPLAMVGGFGMLWAMRGYNQLLGTPPPQLDVVTMLGFVILIGIVVNNAILVVAQALNFHRNDGLEIKQAIVDSVESRIRPIFMSTMTSILGMLPLVLRPGPGSELYQGLGSVVVGGLLISTVFTLILTPVVFSFGFGLTERLRAVARRWGLLVGEPGQDGAGAPGDGEADADQSPTE
ncbi:MAG: efflux RND transporter permease subunit, partial [Phycisphaerae bacterium]